MIATPDIALEYWNRGWAPVPIERCQKGPTMSGWQTLMLAREEIPELFPPGVIGNVGVLLGPASRGLVDVDLDHAIAVELAPAYLPATGAIFGRSGKSRSHWLYTSPGAVTKKLKLPEFGMIVELRSKGCQTVFPGSQHPSGELVEWDEAGEPAEIDPEELHAKVEELHRAVAKRLGVAIPVPVETATAVASHSTPREFGPEIEGRAIKYLATKPPAIEKQDGSGATMGAARAVAWGFGLTEEQTLSIMLTHYNPRCVPPWSEAEMRHKVQDALRTPPPSGKPFGYLRDAETSYIQQPGPQANIDDMLENCGLKLVTLAPSPKPGTPVPATEPRPALPVTAGRIRTPRRLKSRTMGQLLAEFTELRPVVIDELARRGDAINIVGQTKVRKSWLVLLLVICVALGMKWLGRFQCARGRVLIIDNELHPDTLADRVRRVCKAMGINPDDLADQIEIANLRTDPDGEVEIGALDAYLADVSPGEFDLILLDAWYKFQPDGSDENANAATTSAYKPLSRIASRLDCTIAIVHHSSKGNQAGKSVTDVGAGAGSLARATDAHIILREHEEPNVAVFEAALRSFVPVEPFCIQWDAPLWYWTKDFDPAQIKQDKPRRSRAEKEPKDEPAKWDAERFAESFLSESPQTKDAIQERAKEEAGLSLRQSDRLLNQAEHDRLAFRWSFGNRRKAEYSTLPMAVDTPVLAGAA